MFECRERGLLSGSSAAAEIALTNLTLVVTWSVLQMGAGFPHRQEGQLGTPDDTRLLVGGLPTSALPNELSAKLRHHGAFRRMAGGLVAKELGLPEESRDSWIGAGPPDIKAWTESVFQGEYEAFTERNDSGRFSIYTPDGARPGTPQLRRWVDRPEKLSGVFLADELRLACARPRSQVVQGGLLGSSG